MKTKERLMPDENVASDQLSLSVSRYRFAGPIVKDKVVLDLACGTGYGSRYLAQKGAREVIAADIDEKATRIAHLYRNNTYVIQVDAQAMPFRDDSFDVLVSFETIEHLGRQEEFLHECRRVLRNDGLIICSTPNRDVVSPGSLVPTNPYHTREFRPDEFAVLLGKHFYGIKSYGIFLFGSREQERFGFLKTCAVQ